MHVASQEKYDQSTTANEITNIRRELERLADEVGPCSIFGRRIADGFQRLAAVERYLGLDQTITI